MSLEIIDINGHQVVFGLAWRRLTETMSSEAKEIKTIATAEKAKAAAVFRHKGVFCGLATEPLPGKGTFYSGAVLLANAGLGDNCIIVQALGNGQYAVVGLRDGVPSTGMDFVGDQEVATAKANDFISAMGETGITAWSNCEFFSEGKEFDLQEGVTPTAVPAAKLVRVGADHTVPILVVTLLFVFAAGFMWYQDWSEEQARKARVQKQVDPVAQYMESAKSTLAAELTAPAASTSSTYLAQIGALPALRSGWRVAGAYCQSGQCIINWTQSIGGTNRSFTEGAAGAETLSFKPDGKTIDQVLPVAVPPMAAPLGLENLPSSQAFLVEVGSLFQTGIMAGMQATLGGAEVYGVAPGAQKPPAVTGGFLGRGAWVLSGPYSLVREILGELPVNMTLSSLRFTADQTNPLQLSLQAEGYYYVRK